MWPWVNHVISLCWGFLRNIMGKVGGREIKAELKNGWSNISIWPNRCVSPAKCLKLWTSQKNCYDILYLKTSIFWKCERPGKAELYPSWQWDQHCISTLPLWWGVHFLVCHSRHLCSLTQLCYLFWPNDSKFWEFMLTTPGQDEQYQSQRW